MTPASNMDLAKEAMRQVVSLETALAKDVEPDMGRAITLLKRRGGIGAVEALRLMEKYRRGRRIDPFRGAYGVFLMAVSDDAYADFSLLCAVFSRLADRLADRMLSAAKQGAVDEEGDVADEMALMSAVVINTTGSCLEQFRQRIGYKDSSLIGRKTWTTRHRKLLTPNDGITEEHDQYIAADLSDMERRVLESFLAKHWPPLGMCHTFGAVASDVFDRYGCDSEHQFELAIATTSKIFDHALSVIIPVSQAGGR